MILWRCRVVVKFDGGKKTQLKQILGEQKALVVHIWTYLSFFIKQYTIGVSLYSSFSEHGAGHITHRPTAWLKQNLNAITTARALKKTQYKKLKKIFLRHLIFKATISVCQNPWFKNHSILLYTVQCVVCVCVYQCCGVRIRIHGWIHPKSHHLYNCTHTHAACNIIKRFLYDYLTQNVKKCYIYNLLLLAAFNKRGTHKHGHKSKNKY